MTREEEIVIASLEKDNYSRNMSIAGCFRAGAEWADAHQSQIAYLEHEIKVLKSKLQAANDLNTLLTAELEKAKITNN